MADTPQISEDIKVLQGQIELSFKTEEFLASDVGKYLIRRSDEEVEAAVEELKKVSPEDATAIRAIQTRIQVAESVQYWLAAAIEAGHNAARQFFESEQE